MQIELKKRNFVKLKAVRILFMFFLSLCFFLVQTLPVARVLAQWLCPTMSSGKEKIASKRGCCCCGPSACPCDMKKDQAHGPVDFELAFSTRLFNNVLEDMGPLTEFVRQNHSCDAVRIARWMFARAPCPVVYLATHNLLC